MAVSSAELALHLEEQEQWREQGRRRSPSLDRPLPPDPFLDALSPLVPLLSDSSLRNTFYLPKFKPYLDALAELGKPQPSEIEAERSDTADDNVVFIDHVVQSTEEAAIEDDGVEVGRSFYQIRDDDRTYPTRVARGTPDRIPQLSEDLYALLRSGAYPTASMHRHPKLYLPLPSHHDWSHLLHRVYVDSPAPMVRKLSIAGSGVTVMGLVTNKSQPTVNDWECDEFLAMWKDRYENAGDKDQVFVRMAKSMRVPLFMSTDNVRYDRTSPEQIVRIVRQMPAYQKRLAA